MSDEPNDNEIVIIRKNSEAAKQIVNALVKRRPLGWSARSYPTYYREHYAKWIQKDIDKMMVDRKMRTWRYDAFPTTKPQSLYLRINQSLMYLLDNLDHTGKYAKFREQISIARRTGVGIIIKFDEVLEGDQQADVVIGDDSIPEWKRELDRWIEDINDVNPFLREGLILTDIQLTQLENELDGLSGILYTLTTRSVKIIKV